MKYTLLSLFVVLLLWSCGNPKKASSSKPNQSITGRTWDMTFYGKDTILGTGVFVIFSDSFKNTGFDGCRIFTAKTKWVNKQVQFTDFFFQGDRKCDSTNVSWKMKEAFKLPYSVSFKGNTLLLTKKGKPTMFFQERVVVDEPDNEIETTDSTGNN